jgi:hypothetical protein
MPRTAVFTVELKGFAPIVWLDSALRVDDWSRCSGRLDLCRPQSQQLHWSPPQAAQSPVHVHSAGVP